MFTLTKKTDYAIIALSHMAQRPDHVFTARDIAARFHVPSALLMNILKTLAQKELVRSIRGSKGGYRLSIPADQITLEAIIRAIEGPYRFVQCTAEAGDGHGICDLAEVCPVSRPVQKVHARLKAFLNDVTLADIAFDPEYNEQTVQLGVLATARQELME